MRVLFPGKGLQDNLQADIFLLVKVTNRKRLTLFEACALKNASINTLTRKENTKHVFVSSFEFSSKS